MPPPRKKDRLRGSLSPVREQFPPIETLCGGQAELLGKSRPNEGTKTAPAGAGDCVQTAPMGERQAMGVSGAGKHHTGHPVGQRARPGAKTAPGGAGGCLDAGYGRYLPRAIRVIWMHRVGSTARPRIMPS